MIEADNGVLTNQQNDEILDNISLRLRIKLRRLLRTVLNKRLPIRDKWIMPITAMQFLMKKETNLSVFFKRSPADKLTTEIKQAPAYDTRVRNGVYVPDRKTFTDAFRVTAMAGLPSKTKETAFQILNRTIWTTNIAFKTGKRDDPGCDWCGDKETMEHLNII